MPSRLFRRCDALALPYSGAINAATPRRPNTLRCRLMLLDRGNFSQQLWQQLDHTSFWNYLFIECEERTYMASNCSNIYTNISLGISLRVSLLSLFDSLLPASCVYKPTLNGSDDSERDCRSLRRRVRGQYINMEGNNDLQPKVRRDPSVNRIRFQKRWA